MIFHSPEVVTMFKTGGLRVVSHVYRFVLNTQEMNSKAFSNTLELIQDVMKTQDVEYGVIMRLKYSLVFTDGEVSLDPVLTKLVHGINVERGDDVGREYIQGVNLWLGENV